MGFIDRAQDIAAPRSRKAGLIDALGGGTAQGTPGAELPLAPVTPAPVAPPAPTQDFGRLMGYDAGKLNDPNKHDFKYDTARVMSQFDPRQGFTPDVINALNKLDYGTFSGAGDKLSLSGAKNAKDAADFANQDWIYAHKANSDATKWNFGGGGAAPQQAAPAPAAGRPQFAGSTIAPALQADAQGGIQQALGQYGQASDPNYLQKLIAALGGQA
jgi:hypothetical protein